MQSFSYPGDQGGVANGHAIESLRAHDSSEGFFSSKQPFCRKVVAEEVTVKEIALST